MNCSLFNIMKKIIFFFLQDINNYKHNCQLCIGSVIMTFIEIHHGYAEDRVPTNSEWTIKPYYFHQELIFLFLQCKSQATEFPDHKLDNQCVVTISSLMLKKRGHGNLCIINWKFAWMSISFSKVNYFPRFWTQFFSDSRHVAWTCFYLIIGTMN